MTDREMLELAAKAAGIAWSQEYQCYLGEPDVNGVSVKWLPLTDDGDALRLAVKLELDVMFASVRSVDDDVNITIEAGTDPYAATRRAIVRAAAEIGRNME